MLIPTLLGENIRVGPANSHGLETVKGVPSMGSWGRTFSVTGSPQAVPNIALVYDSVLLKCGVWVREVVYSMERVTASLCVRDTAEKTDIAHCHGG